MTIGLVLASIMHELNTAERICLTKLRDDIVADLEPKFVLPYLVQEGIFSEEESKDVLRQDTVENKVRRLLDILCTKGSNGYTVFIRALEDDGNYGWIAKKLNMMHERIKQEIVFMHKVLQNGGVPFSLVHLVSRPELVMKIRDALRGLCTSNHCHNGAVVVHGMMGCGKSVLAAEALRSPQLLQECFPDGVYWIPIGKLREQNDLLLKMHIQLDSLEVGSHKDVLTVEMASCRLKRWCLNARALLVLDDVWSAKVISAFNVGCPLLVTTRDTSVVDLVKMHKISVEVQEGLSIDETKQLFASVFEVAPDMVPPQVADIHQAHRGLPLLMANMAAVLQPYANCPEKWEPYIQQQARTGQRVRHGSGSSYDSYLELILASLDEDDRGYFESFALFLEDIDIPSLVFEVLWGMDSASVEHIMDVLVKKSLVRKEPVHDSYTYGIHDLYLSFLKRRSSESLKDLHRQFVEKLLKRWKPWEMPCRRNYFYCYLGYHLDAAGMGQELRDIFLDLRFVERKVQCIGPTDLVSDLHRYEHQFRSDPQVAKERQDMQRFLQPNVHFLSGRDADVIQLALREPRSSSVHAKAMQLARKRVSSNHEAPYFVWTNMPDTRSQAAVRMKHEKGGVNHAEFSPDDSLIASAGEDGSVRLWQSQSGNELQVLRLNQPGDASDGDVPSVNFCAFSPDGKHLASASSDCKVYLWNITAGIKSAPASPMIVSSRPARRTDSRKSSACSTFAEVQHSAPVLCCAFSADGKLLASGDERGCVKLHRIVKLEELQEVESAVPQQSRAVRSCCFTRDSRRLVLTLGGHEVLIWELFLASGGAQAAEPRPPQILSHEDCAVADCCLSHSQRLVSTARQQLISAAGQHVWTWDLQDPSQGSAKRYNGFWMSYNLTCCAVSPDGGLIAAGTSLRAILLWNADTGAALGSFKGDAEDVKSVRFSHDGTQLVSASSDGTVVVWDVAEYRRCSRAALMPVLDVVFDERGPLVASVDEAGILQISSGLNTKLEAKHALDGSENNNRCEEVSCCCFTHDREALVLGTKSGHVSLFKLGTKECLALGSHNDCVTSILAWPEGLAISASLDATVKMWHKDGTHRTLSGHQGQITAPCRLFGDGSSRLLSSSNKGELLVWNWASPYKLLARIGASSNDSAVLCCDASPDGQFILSGSADKSVQLWKSVNSDQLWNLDASEALDACVRCCRFGSTSRGTIAAAGTDKGSVYVCSLDEKSWQRVGQHNLNSWVLDLAFSPDGRQLASLSESICWWSLDLESEWAAYLPEDGGSIPSVDSQPGRRSHRLLRRFQLQSSRAAALFVSPDFDTFVTADDSGILYVLNKVVAEEEG
ncbi:apoptotic protease-activating factor 1-like isoform X2 [Haemaphysalis longicornis]